MRNKQKKFKKISLVMGISLVSVIAAGCAAFAAPNITLKSSASDNTVYFQWENSDTSNAFTYNMFRRVNGGAYSNIGSVGSNLRAEDTNYVDINVPSIVTQKTNTLNGVNGVVEYGATDEGSKYEYYVEATQTSNSSKTSSSVIAHTITSEIKGYSYVIDTNASTDPDNSVDTTAPKISYILDNGPNTYLHIKAIDNAGNVGQTAHILLHSNVKPALTLKPDATDWVNKDVTIVARGTDEDGTVVSIKCPDGTVSNSAIKPYVVTTNGTYTFVATDNSGATETQTINIDVIDKVAPNATYTITQPTSTNRYTKISLTATDDASGIATIKLPNGTVANGTSVSYNVKENGTYTFVVTDVAGNEKNIDVPVNVKSDGIVVKYIDIGTGEEILTQEVGEGNIGDEYTLVEKTKDGYQLVTRPTDASTVALTMDKIELEYGYRKLSTVVTKYVDENTGAEIPGNAQVSKVYKEGDSYSTQKKEIPGYTYTKSSGAVTGEVGRENIEVIYYYKKTTGGLVVRYIDQATGGEIADRVEKVDGVENDEYRTTAKEIVGYELVVTPDNANGTLSSTETMVTYEYRKNSNVVVKYLDENTGREIADTITTKYKQDDPYTTEKKTINEYTYTKDTGNTAGTVARTDIEVIYYYKKSVAGLVIKYIDQATGREISAQDVKTDGVENDLYTTHPKDIAGYELVLTPENANGRLTPGQIVITYEYRKNSNVIVQYVDANSNAKIISDVVTKYKEGDGYRTEEKTFDGYQIVDKTDNLSGTVARENITVTYKYKKISTGVDVKFIDQVTRAEIADTVHKNGVENDEYTTEPAKVEGYELVLTPANANGRMTSGLTTVTYEYRINTDVIVHYIDHNHGNKLIEDVVTQYKQGDPYTTQEKVLEGYKLTERPTNATGNAGRVDTVVTYKYKKISDGVDIKYIDQVTKKEIKSKDHINGLEADAYTTTPQNIEGYELVLTPDNANGTMIPDLTEVTYEYRKNSNVISKYIDVNSDSNIIDDVVVKYKEGDPYTTDEKLLAGHTLIGKTNNTSGIVGREDITVIYNYKKNSGGLVVKYIDQVTKQEIADGYTGVGLENDTYTTYAKEVEGYELVLTPDNANGKLAVDETVVVYEYRKNSNVICEYIDENYGTEIIETIVTKYKQGDSYTTEEKSFDGYELTNKTDNTSGEVGRDNITVTYRYKKISAGVEVRYLDQVTGAQITDSVIKEGLEKDNYTSTAKEVEGYELVLTPENAIGKMKVEKTYVDYQYRKNSNVVTKYIDENTGEQIPGVDVVTVKYKEGDSYTTDKKVIDGYTYTKDTGNTAGLVVKDNIEVIYYYKKVSAGVEIKYIDQATGDPVADTIIKTGVENDNYTSTAKEVLGYELVVTPANANGKLTPGKIVVTYEYKKISYVTTKYVDENTGNELCDFNEDKYLQGDRYTTEQKSFEGYKLTRNSGNISGVVGRESIEVVYYYKKISSVTVKYVDMMDNNKEIAETIVISGVENDDYETQQKDIPGFVFVELEGKKNGKLKDEPTEVIYKYKRVLTLTTEHIDENTGEKIIEDIVRTYKEGDKYEALAQNLPGYIMTKEPESKTGTMGNESITRTFYYKKISGGVVVKYVDKITGDLLYQEEFQGKENDVITLEEKKILGFVVDERPDVSEVVLGVEGQEFVYYYRKAISIQVVGINQETLEELYSLEVSGVEGDEYTTTPRQIDDYKLIRVPENANGIFDRNNTKVVYEYGREAGRVVVRYVDKETGTEFTRYEITGTEGQDYATEKRSFDGYDFVEVVGQTVGKLSLDSKEVVYYYERKSGNVVVRYIDTDGNEVLREESQGKLGTKYVVVEKAVRGYEVIERPENLEGTYKDGTIELIFRVKRLNEGEAEKGDLDRNGYISANDAAIILDIYKNNNATPEDIKIGDMNGDGVINALDAAIILDMYKKGN